MQTLHYLARRGNWQLAAHQGGAMAEADTMTAIRTYLDTAYPGQWEVTTQPKDLDQIYFEYTYERDPTRYAKPAVPTAEDVWFDEALKVFLSMSGAKVKPATGGGCRPDGMIKNKATGLCIFIECKNQAAAGNAHERGAKYATPSVIAHVQKKLGVTYHPFGHIFTGALVETRKYVVELETTYGFAPNHLLLWRKERPVEPLTQWLEAILLPLRP